MKLSTISTSFDGGFEENSDFVVLDLCIGDPEEGNLKYYNDNLKLKEISVKILILVLILNVCIKSVNQLVIINDLKMIKRNFIESFFQVN